MTQPPPNSSAPSAVPTEEAGAAARKTYPSAELIQHTIRLWEPRLGRPLTEEDARQILEKVVGTFNLLHEWDIKEQCQSNNLAGSNDEIA